MVDARGGQRLPTRHRSANMDLISTESSEAVPPARSAEPANLLQDLDRRQNHVIKELDELNARIDQVLTQWNRDEYGDDAIEQSKSAA